MQHSNLLCFTCLLKGQGGWCNRQPVSVMSTFTPTLVQSKYKAKLTNVMFSMGNGQWWVQDKLKTGCITLHASSGLMPCLYSLISRALGCSFLGACYTQECLCAAGSWLVEVWLTCPLFLCKETREPRQCREDKSSVGAFWAYHQNLFAQWNMGSEKGSFPAAHLCLLGGMMIMWEISL